jgi:hypothetical protein
MYGLQLCVFQIYVLAQDALRPASHSRAVDFPTETANFGDSFHSDFPIQEKYHSLLSCLIIEV